MGKSMSESAHAENMLSALRSNSHAGAVLDAAAYIDAVADQLDKWAEESRSGGWSTHQVQPQINLANSCRRMASGLRRRV